MVTDSIWTFSSFYPFTQVLVRWCKMRQLWGIVWFSIQDGIIVANCRPADAHFVSRQLFLDHFKLATGASPNDNTTCVVSITSICRWWYSCVGKYRSHTKLYFFSWCHTLYSLSISVCVLTLYSLSLSLCLSLYLILFLSQSISNICIISLLYISADKIRDNILRPSWHSKKRYQEGMACPKSTTQSLHNMVTSYSLDPWGGN